MKSEGPDLDSAERGVNGRNIVVMHNTNVPNGRPNGAPDRTTNGGPFTGDSDNSLNKFKDANDAEESSSPTARTRSRDSDLISPTDEKDSAIAPDLPHPTQITFADQVRRSDGLNDMADRTLSSPIQRSKEDHIAFLERQRNPQDKGVLRIPGPRDADAGVVPETVDENDVLNRPVSRRSTFSNEPGDSRNLPNLGNGNTEENRTQRGRNITIEEPTRQDIEENVSNDARAAVNALDIFGLRKFFSRHHWKRHDTKPKINLHGLRSVFSTEKTTDLMPYLSWEPTVGRNSAFVDLTAEQREELGGIEYRSLKSLALILFCYFWGFSAFAVTSLLPWILYHNKYGDVVRSDGIGRPWWAFFTACSAFNDLGFTLTPDSMISFNTAIWPLLVMSFLIIIGNTGFPVMLRIIIWFLSKIVRKESGLWDELNFLLDHPRRCFTLLFPSKATWWLFGILVVLNGLDLIFFIILDVGPFACKYLYREATDSANSLETRWSLNYLFTSVSLTAGSKQFPLELQDFPLSTLLNCTLPFRFPI